MAGKIANAQEVPKITFLLQTKFLKNIIPKDFYDCLVFLLHQNVYYHCTVYILKTAVHTQVIFKLLQINIYN